MNVVRNCVELLPEAVIHDNLDGLGHNEDKPEKKPEAEPHKLPKEDPGIDPVTEPKPEKEDDDDDPWEEPEIGDDPDDIKTKITVM